jgi:RNA polymerase sigma-70 factor (ECF subfamily)
LPEELADDAPSLVEKAIGTQALERYEALTVCEAQQEAVILRVEMGLSYQEIADAIGSPSANVARMSVSRALVRLAEVMADYR